MGLYRPTFLGIYISSSLTGLLLVVLILTLIYTLICASETISFKHPSHISFDHQPQSDFTINTFTPRSWRPVKALNIPKTNKQSYLGTSTLNSYQTKKDTHLNCHTYLTIPPTT